MMKPKVLIFIDWFTPGYKAGGPTTSNVNIVNHLSDDFDFGSSLLIQTTMRRLLILT